jgi:amidase
MFAAIAGADPQDPTSRSEPADDWIAAARLGSLAGVRIGIDAAYALSGIDPAIATGLKAVIAKLESQGATIVEVKLPPVDHVLERATAAAMVEAAVSHARTYPSERTSYSKTYSNLLDVGHATTARDYAAVAIWRREFQGQLSRIFASIDMLIAPVLPVLPLSVSDMQAMEDAPPLASAGLLRYTIPFNLAGVPTLTLPMERIAGVAPLGFQLIGPELGEAKLLAAGAAYEAGTGFSNLHPDI